MLADLISLLRCPSCRSNISCGIRSQSRDDGLVCTGCNRYIPVVDGIPRFVDIVEDVAARRTQASFGYEWTHFHDWRESGKTNFNDYFQGIDLNLLRGRLVLDGGCGMGRHARQMAPFANRVVAVDFSRAIDQARRNTADVANVDCIQADLLSLPFADGSFDFVYSLGVLHHLDDTERALANLVRQLKPGGRLRVYLYWKKHGWQRYVVAGVTLVRRVTTRLPFAFLRALCWILSAGLYVGIVLPYRVFLALGIRGHSTWPLFVYSKYPFSVLYNDQFDRFSAPIEKRYDAEEVRNLLRSVGLSDVQVRPCFGWLADGIKPS